MDTEYAPTSGIDAHRQTVTDLVSVLFGVRPPFFLSDESSLFDFGPLPGGADPAERINAIFGVDISDIEDGNLVRIAERIDAIR